MNTGPRVDGFVLAQVRKVGVRGYPERDISPLRALGPGGGQISSVVDVSTRAAFGVFPEDSLCIVMFGERSPNITIHDVW